jgi:hypothetical protein
MFACENMRGICTVWSYGAVYSITTFIGGISPPLQIRQVARLMEHDMQPARTKPHKRGAHKQPRPET